MSGIGLSDLVQDWGGFEQLVAELHETGDVTVERNVVLTGRSGAPRQIDVLVRHKKGFYEHKVVTECKFRNQAVERIHVDALATTVREVGADRGVMFSTKGFQSGAITEVQHQGIELFKVREPTDEEWGLPGRHVDIWLHIISTAIGNLTPINPYSLGAATNTNIDVVLGDEHAPGTSIIADGRTQNTLEELLTYLALDSAKQSYKPVRVQFEDGGFSGEIRFVINVNYEPLRPLQIFSDGRVLFVPKMTFQVGVLVSQSRLQIDRGQHLAFALAVEDCIRSQVTSASRLKEGGSTVLVPLQPNAIFETSDVFKNGSILQVWTKPYQRFEDFSNLEPGKSIARVTPQPTASL
jgi:hypothetical protein